MVSSYPMSILVGTVLGFLSGLGIGGGSLLVLWLTVVLHMQPQTARIINLLFFIPSAVISCLIRMRRKELRWKETIPAMFSGCISAGVFSVIFGGLDAALLKKLFAFLLIGAGLREVLYRARNAR